MFKVHGFKSKNDQVKEKSKTSSWIWVVLGRLQWTGRRWEGVAVDTGLLANLCPIVQKPKHNAALTYAEMGEFMAVLRERTGLGAQALEFTILTAARTGEVISARWEEFDLTKKLWTIPAERMKAAKEHTIPLSKRALEIVRELEKVKTGPFIFPGVKEGEPLSNMAMNATLKRMEYHEITVYEFRSTFPDWAGEQTNFPREIIEHALAHKLKDKAEAAYSRSTLPEKRRKLMEDWANYCIGQETKAILGRNLESQKKTPGSLIKV